MSFRFLSAGAALAIASLSIQGGTLRVCADPNNLPFSNEREQGFENKLASLIAAELGDSVAYTWWGERKSLVKNTLLAGRCDVLLGVPLALEGVETTAPYYRSTYVFVTRRGLHITSLADPQLRQLRIGLHVVGENYAPPSFALARLGIVSNIKGYSLFGAYGQVSPARSIVDAVESGDIDVAIVWGPFAGYFSRHARIPLEITPVSPPVFMGVPFTYSMALAVRPGADVLKARLDRALEVDTPQIQELLGEYGVPQVP